MLFRAGARGNVLEITVFGLKILHMRVQHGGNERRRSVERRRLLVVLILEGIPHIWEVLEQLCDHLFLLFGCWSLAGQDFDALARGDILHVSACAFTADEAGFLNQPRHLLQSTLLPKHLRKRDLTVCPQHLLIAFSAHLLVRLRVDIRI